jgi:long-chain acyl-CoA synthetase
MGIQSKNRKEWVLTHCADIHQSITTVALYDTLGAEATMFVLEQTQMTTMAVSEDYVVKLAKMKIADIQADGKMTLLKNLIVFENGITEEMKNLASEADITLYTLEEVIFKGREAENKSFIEPTPDTCFAFSYTSGTTGDPKGVKLSHKMGITSSSAVNYRCGDLKMTEADSYISYLPAAHSFEQCIFSMSCVTGLKCGFFAGNILKLTEDIGVLKPTLFPSVPRLFNRIYGKIMDGTKAATGVKGWLVNKAIAAKLWHYRAGNGL